MTSQKRAKVGGEVGANGEFYEGGKFVSTTAANAKRHGSTPRKPRKVEIAPYTWVLAEEGQRPLFSIVGTGAEYIDRYDPAKGIKPYLPAFDAGVMYNGETLGNVQAMCDRYNAGEVWM